MTAPATDASKLSWVCRLGDSEADRQQRHLDFVANIRTSGLPASSQGQVLRQLNLIEANVPVYCAAERLTGVPALVLAALHYREANNDPTRSIMSGEPLGAVNPDTHAVEGTTPIENAVDAAHHLITGAAEIYGVRVRRGMNTIDLAYALAAYNRGGRYCRAGEMHPMLSPYVASGLVASNVSMRWPDVGSDDGAGPEAWGEPSSVRGRPDPRIGALTIARGLGSEITAPAFAWNTDEVVIACR
jgi:lysozyme family protein